MLRHWEKIVAVLSLLLLAGVIPLELGQQGRMRTLESQSRLATRELESMLTQMEPPRVPKQFEPTELAEAVAKRWRGGVDAPALPAGVLGEAPEAGK
jgi:hypothetical protein